MRTIVRIEDSKGIGICRSKLADNLIDEIVYKVMRDFRSPLNDPGINRYPKTNEYCAFRSLRQLKSLYSKEDLQYLQSAGFKIYLISIEKYTLGKRQVLFRKVDIIKKELITL